ncbi:MAG: cystathionine beta-lyase [Pseudomonadota bacterium]
MDGSSRDKQGAAGRAAATNGGQTASGARPGFRDATKAVAGGRRPEMQGGAVNPPIYRASTIVSSSLADLRARNRIRPGDGLTYGVHGTPGTFAFEEALAELEGGWRTRLCSTGLTAATAPLLCYLNGGDHLLMTDSVYGPTRSFCDGMLRRLGIETTYFDPLIGVGLRDLIRPNTRVVYLESPGSWTFEVQDTPTLAAIANEAGCWTMLDNTWASPLYFKPFEHGVDVSIQAATKYIAGHSDLLLGAVTTTEAAYPKLQKGWQDLGLSAAPDDVFNAMRGLRTMPTRLARHWENGLRVAEWLARQPEVEDILHPALPHDPGHALWRRDFRGASSLFGFILSPSYSDERRLAALLDDLELHAMGYSWGGFESLLIPVDPARIRTAGAWPRAPRPQGQVMRIHVGLEDPDDLIDDLAAGFDRMRRLRL